MHYATIVEWMMYSFYFIIFIQKQPLDKRVKGVLISLSFPLFKIIFNIRIWWNPNYLLMIFLIRWKSKKGNRDSNRNRKNIIQEKRPYKENIHIKVHEITKIRRTQKQEQMSNSNFTKNSEHGPGAPVG